MKGLRAEKAAVRASMKALRDAIAPGERVRMAAAVDRRLAELPQLRTARTVMLFWSFGSEVPTGGIARRFHAEGRRVVIPYVTRSRMVAGELREGDILEPTDYGPMEPADRRPVEPGEIDVVVVPGLAFDREGHRVGYGGGYFDRFLAGLRQDATRVGIAFHQQILPSVPNGPADQQLDVVVTDQETIVCQAWRPKP